VLLQLNDDAMLKLLLQQQKLSDGVILKLLLQLNDGAMLKLLLQQQKLNDGVILKLLLQLNDGAMLKLLLQQQKLNDGEQQQPKKKSADVLPKMPKRRCAFCV
jgi:hypothetical protein